MSCTRKRSISYRTACEENSSITIAVNEKESESVTIDLSQWMTNLPEPLTKIPLNKLAIPGSHDSGAYYLDPNTPVSSGQPNFIRKYGDHFKNIIIKWSLTQKDNISLQLQNGVRYFDMRLGYLESKDDFLFVHGVHGHSIIELLKEIHSFLSSHVREIVIVDFNHFYNFTDALHHRFIENVSDVFKDMIYSKREGESPMTSSLSHFWTVKKQVFVRYTHSTVGIDHEHLWPKCSISSPWFNTDSTEVLIAALNSNIQQHRVESLNISQAILTPQMKTVVLNLTSSLHKRLVARCNVAVKKWLRDVYETRRQGVNIVMCDFICEDGFTTEIIRLNEIIEQEN